MRKVTRSGHNGPMSTIPEYIPLSELARAIGRTDKALRNRLYRFKRGEDVDLPQPYDIGGRLMFERADVLAWLESSRIRKGASNA